MRWLTLILSLLYWAGLSGQIDSPRKLFDTKNGLPQIQVLSLFEDSRGYIWIGTKGGVARYNGESFKNFNQDDGLQNRQITGFTEMPTGEIAVLGKDGIDLIDGDDIQALHSQRSGNTGYYFRYSDDTFNQNIIIPYGQSLTFVSAQDTIVYTDDSIFCFKRTTFTSDTTFSAFCNLGKDGFSIDHYLVSNRQITRVGREFRKMNMSNAHEEEQYYEEINSKKDVGKVKVYDEFENLLVRYEFDFSPKIRKVTKVEVKAELKNPIYIITVRSKDLVEVYNDRIIEYPYGAFIRSYLSDSNGNLWIGGERGLLFMPASPFKQLNKTNLTDVWGVYQRGNIVTTSSYGNGVLEIDLKTFNTSRIEIPTAESSYYSIVEGSENATYFPLSGHGIMKNDQGHFTHLAERFDTVSGGLLLKNAKFSEDELIFGKRRELSIYNIKSNTWDSYKSDNIEGYIVGLASDNKGNIWSGTFRSLSKLDAKSKSFRQYFGNTDSHPMKGAVSLDNDDLKSIWVGGLRGLYRIDIASDQLLPVDTITFAKPITAIETIGDSLLAIATLTDFAFMDLRTFYRSGELIYKRYNRFNGFDGEEVAQSALHLAGDTLWIPCSDGLYFINVNDVRFDAPSSKAIITKINKASIPYSHSGNWDLPYNKNDIRIDYETVGFNRSYETSYSYKLHGIDEEWSDWETDHFTIYQRLPSGIFNFEVRSRYNLLEDYVSASIPIVISLDPWIHPEFYKYALFGLLILGGGMMYQMWRRSQSKVDYAIQEQRVNYLQIQTLQSQMNPHFMFNVLSAIQNNILRRDVKKANEHLVNLSTLIRRFLDASVKTNLSDGSLENSSITLDKECELLRLYIEFEQLQYPGAFDYSINLDLDRGEEDLLLPPLLLQPFVENSIKHGLLPLKTGGELSIDISSYDDMLNIKIQDNGVGRKNAAKTQTTKYRFKSHGTELIRKRIDILNKMGESISCITSDLKPNGTEVILKIKLN